MKGCKMKSFAWRDLYRATPAMTRNLGLQGLIQMITPLNCLFPTNQGKKNLF